MHLAPEHARRELTRQRSGLVLESGARACDFRLHLLSSVLEETRGGGAHAGEDLALGFEPFVAELLAFLVRRGAGFRHLRLVRRERARRLLVDLAREELR